MPQETRPGARGWALGAQGWALGAIAIAAAIALSACSSQTADPAAAYAEKLLASRAQKDEAFRRQPNEPIPVDKYGEFLPLKYFPPDQAYEVPASLKPAEIRVPVRIPTSTGKLRDMEVVGTLTFMLNGQRHTLDALVEAGTPPDQLFVPFMDATSGTETYAAGRYLEIPRSTTGVYVIDFNLAFQPFCSYNHDYDCPYPPAQNRLPVPVRAGEKLATPLLQGHGAAPGR